jgi:hypothetical protein
MKKMYDEKNKKINTFKFTDIEVDCLILLIRNETCPDLAPPHARYLPDLIRLPFIMTLPRGLEIAKCIMTNLTKTHVGGSRRGECPLFTVIKFEGKTKHIKSKDIDNFMTENNVTLPLVQSGDPTTVEIEYKPLTTENTEKFKQIRIPTAIWEKFNKYLEKEEEKDQMGGARGKKTNGKWQLTSDKVTTKDGVSRSVYKNIKGLLRIKKMVTQGGVTVASYVKF